jgi:hypothetical protein
LAWHQDPSSDRWPGVLLQVTRAVLWYIKRKGIIGGVNVKPTASTEVNMGHAVHFIILAGIYRHVPAVNYGTYRDTLVCV